MDTRSFTDPDGIEIVFRHWPVDVPNAAVVIAHGASEHSRRYDRFAGALNGAGYSVYAIDHRGHGDTGGGQGKALVGPGGPHRLVDDFHQLVELAAGENAGTPVVSFGHSMGALIAHGHAVAHGASLAGYVLSGPPGPMQGADELLAGMAGAVEGGLGDEPIDLLSGFNAAFDPARTPYDWLSRDEAEVDAYIADPLCGDDNPLTYGYVHAMLAIAVPAFEQQAIEDAAPIPLLLVAGALDPAAEMGETVREIERRFLVAERDVTAIIYPGARHELLNEINRDEVTSDIVDWLARVEAN